MAVSYVPVGSRRSAVLGNALTFVLLLILAAAQSAWPTWLRLWGATPDLVLAAVITTGLTSGGSSGVFAGFCGAFLWASIGDQPMGNLFLSYMGLGFLAGSMRGRMFSDRLLLAVILVAAGVIVAGVINLVLAPPPSPQSWLAAVFARAAFTGLLTVAIYPLARLLSLYHPLPEEP